MHSWTERDVAGDPDAQAATDWLRRHYLHSFLERYEAWLDVQGSWPIDWQDAAGASDYALRLSPARLAAFNADVAGAVRALPRDARPTTTADEEIVQLYVYAFPLEARPTMTTLDARGARRRYLILIGLRWLPTGLLIPVIVLLALSRGLSLTEIGLVFSIQGLVVLALELPDRRAVRRARSASGPHPRQRRRPPLARPALRRRLGRDVRRGDLPAGHLPRARQRPARGLVRRRDAGRRTRRGDREGPERGHRRAQHRHRGRRARVGRARRARPVRRRRRRWRCRSSSRSGSAS